MTRASQRVAKAIAGWLEMTPDAPDYYRIPVVDLKNWIIALAPPRKKPIRRKPSKARASTKELDTLCREVVMERDKNCRLCTSGGLAPTADIRRRQLQWCHIFSRRYKWMRWDLDNSMILCAGHHLWQHHNPALAMDAIEKLIGKGAMHRLKMLASKPRKVSPELVKAYLEQERKKL